MRSTPTALHCSLSHSLDGVTKLGVRCWLVSGTSHPPVLQPAALRAAPVCLVPAAAIDRTATTMKIMARMAVLTARLAQIRASAIPLTHIRIILVSRSHTQVPARYAGTRKH